jgi:uncharacterized protein (DUF1800 family)
MAATDLLTEAQADHLLRRAAFGPRPGQAQALAGTPRDRAVAALLGAKTRKKKPPAKNNNFETFRRMQRWWLQQMRHKKFGAQEKLALFWHDHFPSSFFVVFELDWMAAQNGLFREMALGNFRDLVYRVTRDPAMLQYLDGFRNRAENPNENYARELMELFVLGREDLLGVPNYTQDDVVQLARALTGFRLVYRNNRATDQVYLDSDNFDAGEKTLFEGMPYQVIGNLGVENADGVQFPPNINVIDILLTHTDSEGRPTAARFISKKLWEWYAYPNPPLALVDELADLFVAANYEIRPLVEAVLVHDEFYTDQAMSSTAKNPVEFATQMILALDTKSSFENLPNSLERMGMDLFNPPSVNGWNHSEAWLATARFRERFFLAQRIAGGRSKKDGGYLVKASKLLDPSATDTAQIVDGLLARFGIRNAPAATRQSLITYLDSGLAMGDEEWLEVKFRGVLVLLLTLPEFQVH